MKDKLLLDNLKINKNITIPNYLIQNINKLDINLEEFILIT